MSWESYTRKLVSRIGDEERHKVAELLGDHLAHGRLTQEEFEERLAAAFDARTAGELGKLLADLPAVRGEQDQRRPVPRKPDDRPWAGRLDHRPDRPGPRLAGRLPAPQARRLTTCWR
jgi:hypothetical protein